jgi:hypothetical protein
MNPDDLSLRQLRAELKKKRLSPSGSKADLQVRLKAWYRDNGGLLSFVLAQRKPKPSSLKGTSNFGSIDKNPSLSPSKVYLRSCPLAKVMPLCQLDICPPVMHRLQAKQPAFAKPLATRYGKRNALAYFVFLDTFSHLGVAIVNVRLQLL